MSTKFSVSMQNGQIVISPMLNISILDKEQDFILDIENAQFGINKLYKESPDTLNELLDQLLKIAQVGLVGDNPHLDLSKKALQQLKNEITNNKSSIIKSAYLINLGKIVLLYSIMFLCFYFIFFYLGKRLPPESFNSQVFSCFALLLLGSMIGIWVSSAFSKLNLNFDGLVTINSNQFKPHIKVIFTALLTFIFGLLFYKQLVIITIGKITSDIIFSDIAVALIFGIILGLNERLFGNNLLKKVDEIVKI